MHGSVIYSRALEILQTAGKEAPYSLVSFTALQIAQGCSDCYRRFGRLFQQTETILAGVLFSSNRSKAVYGCIEFASGRKSW